MDFAIRLMGLIASQGLFENWKWNHVEFELQPFIHSRKTKRKKQKKNTPPKKSSSETRYSLEVWMFSIIMFLGPKLLVLGGFIDVLLLTLTCEA